MRPIAERFETIVNMVKRWRMSAEVEMEKIVRRGVSPISAPAILRDFRSPRCWCGHYVKNHMKDGCKVFDCPCQKAMDPLIMVCTRCCQTHSNEIPCPIPGQVSEGVLVNFKPAKESNEKS